MAAIEAGRRGRRVLLLEKSARPAEKIRISGGGRCNFTTLHCSPANFLSQNPRFCVSALQRYPQQDFIARVDSTEERRGGKECCSPVRSRWWQTHTKQNINTLYS